MEYFRSRKRLQLTGNSVHATISGWTQMALQFTVDIGRNFAHKDAPCVQASMKGRFLQSYPRHVYSYHKMFLGKNNYCFHYCFHVYINQFHVGISFKALIISDQMMKVLLQNFRALWYSGAVLDINDNQTLYDSPFHYIHFDINGYPCNLMGFLTLRFIHESYYVGSILLLFSANEKRILRNTNQISRRV